MSALPLPFDLPWRLRPDDARPAGPPPDGWPQAGAAALASVGLTLGWLDGTLAPAAALMLHLLLVLLLVLAARHHRRRHGVHAPLLLLLAGGCAVLGPVGVVGAMAAWGLRGPADERTGFLSDDEPVDEADGALAGAASGAGTAGFADPADPAAPDTLAAFADVLRLGTLSQRQSVIGLIAARYDPAFAGALAVALRDAEPAVRVQAATAMARLESGWLKEAIALERPAASPQERTPASTRQQRLALARHLDAHAHSGLLDEDRAQATRRRALGLYALGGAADGAEALLAEVRLLTRLGRQAEAIARVEPRIAAGEAGVELLAWYAECLYARGRYGPLRELCRQHLADWREAASLSPASRAALLDWGRDWDAGPDQPETDA